MSGKIKFHKLRLPSSRSSQNSQISNFFKPSSMEEQSNSCTLPSETESEPLGSCCNSPLAKKIRSCSPFKMDEISLSPNMQADDKSFSSKDSPEKMKFFDKTTSEFDFVPSPRERKVKKTVHQKPKVTGRKAERKQPKIKNVFSSDNRRLSELLTAQSIAEGVSPDELQMALALSMSEASHKAEQDHDSQMSGEVPIGIQLEKFAYNPNCNRNAGEVEFFPLYYKRKGRAVNKFTALTMRNPKKQDQKVEKYVSQFLSISSDKESLVDAENPIDRIGVNSGTLECMKAEVSIIQMHAVPLKEIENYFVKGVFHPTLKNAGCLLRDYRKIPGRSVSPEPAKVHSVTLLNNCDEVMIQSIDKSNEPPAILINDKTIVPEYDNKDEVCSNSALDNGRLKINDLKENTLSLNSFSTSNLAREFSPDLFSEFETEQDKTETAMESNITKTGQNGTVLQTDQEQSKIPETVMETKHAQDAIEFEDCEISTYEKYSSDEAKKIQSTIQEPSQKSVDCVIDLTEGDESEIESSTHSPLRDHIYSSEKQLSQNSLKSSSSSYIVLSDDEVNYSIRKADETLKKLKKIVGDTNEEPENTSRKISSRNSFEYSRLATEFQRKVDALDTSNFLKTPRNYLKKYQKEYKTKTFADDENEKSGANSDESTNGGKEFDDDDFSINGRKMNFSGNSKNDMENVLSTSSDYNEINVEFLRSSPLSECDRILHDQIRFDASGTGSILKNSEFTQSTYNNVCKVVHDDINTSLVSECGKIINDQFNCNMNNPSPTKLSSRTSDIKKSCNFDSDSEESNVRYRKDPAFDFKPEYTEPGFSKDHSFVNIDSPKVISSQKNYSPIVYEITDSDSEEWKDPVIQAVDILKYSPLKDKKRFSFEDLHFDSKTLGVSKCLEEQFLNESMQNSTPKLSSTKFKKNNSDSTIMDVTMVHKKSFKRHSSAKKFSDLLDDDINYSDLDEIDKLVHGSARMQYDNFRKPRDIDKLLSATIEGEINTSFSLDTDNFKKPKVFENLGTSKVETNTNTSMEEFIQDGVKYKVRYKDICIKPNYNQMDNELLIQELNKYGLKPLKKKQAVIMLEYIYNQMHPIILDNEINFPALEASPEKNVEDLSSDKTSECNEETGTQQKTGKFKSFNFEDCTGERLLYKDILSSEVEDEFYIFPTSARKKVSSCLLPLHVAWFNLVKSNRKLRQAIVCYEPVDLQEIYLFFKSIGYRYDPKDMKAFFDKRCIIFRYDLTDGTKNRHTRKIDKRRKKISASQR